MFVASLASFLFAAGATGAPFQPALKTCPDKSIVRADQACAPSLDHRRAYSLRPDVVSQTIEWRCDRRSVRAQIRTVEQPSTNERGETVRKHKFNVELASLEIDGAPASPESIAKVRGALAPLNTVIQFYGMCFSDGVPELNIGGYSLSDPPREPRRARIELK